MVSRDPNIQWFGGLIPSKLDIKQVSRLVRKFFRQLYNWLVLSQTFPKYLIASHPNTAYLSW